MGRSKRFLAAVILVLLSTAGFSAAAAADVNDFVINDFSADYVLTRNDPQGELTITEHIDLTYSDNNHGILRAIPQKYKSHSLKLKILSVSSDSGAPVQYSTYTSNDNLVLKIGDPNRTVTGKQSYTIKYQVQNVIGFYDGHDELYWDINGDQWQQPFLKVTARIQLPSELTLQNQRCFTGAFGSTASECTIESAETGNTAVAETTQALSGYQTLTAVVTFNKGYFTAPTWQDWLRDNLKWMLMLILPPLAIGIWGYRKWRVHGKDLRGKGVIVPQYDAPDNLSPAEVGTILRYRLDTQDISATIIDLAIRKYIKIIETKEKKILKDKLTHELELLNADFIQLLPHEQTILKALFKDQSVGAKVNLSSMANKLYGTASQLQSSMPASLATKEYFVVNPRKAGTKLYIAMAILFVVAFGAFYVHIALGFGFIIAALITLVFALLMPKRTEKGVAALDHIKGLQLYLKTAEEDRIKMLQSPDAKYAPNHSEPVKTVELFEKLLPFAIVLGVENQWAKQFEHIYTTEPDWYSGNWATFNAVYLTSSLDNAVGAVSASFTSPSSSSGSGSSGGSAGGGGGGGGGGGW